MGTRESGKGGPRFHRIVALAIAALAVAFAPGGGAAETNTGQPDAGHGWHGHEAFGHATERSLLAAASVQGESGPFGLPGSDGLPQPMAPAEPPTKGIRAAWSDHLQEMLLVAGFDDAVLLSGRDLKRLGDRLTAAWVAPNGDLFGLLYVFPAKEPGLTMQTFVDQVSQNCPGQFHGGVAKLDAVKDRSIGRAEATCRQTSKAVHYDMIFYFTPDGTVGISHVGYDADLDRARRINNGLMEIFYGL